MFHFKAITAKKTFIDQDVDEVIVPSLKGPLSISTGYTNIIEVLQNAGVMKVISGNSVLFCALIQGVIRVENGSCTVIAEDINFGNDIDLDRAINAKNKMLERLKEEQSEYDFKVAKIKLDKAIARIDAKTLSNGGKL